MITEFGGQVVFVNCVCMCVHYFSGDFHSYEELTNCLYQNFPKLRTAGGYELLKSSGNTRNRQLSVIQCPNEGYTVQYLKEPSTMIHHCIIYIRPLQCNISMEQVTISTFSQSFAGIFNCHCHWPCTINICIILYNRSNLSVVCVWERGRYMYSRDTRACNM